MRQDRHTARRSDLLIDPLAVAVFQGIDTRRGLGLFRLGKKLCMDALLVTVIQCIDTVSASHVHNVDPAPQMHLLTAEHLQITSNALVCTDHAVGGLPGVVIGQRKEIVSLLAVVGGNHQGILLTVRACRVGMKIAPIGVTLVKIGQKRKYTEFEGCLLFLLRLCRSHRNHPFLLLKEGIGHRKATVLGIDRQTVKANGFL